MREKDKSKIGAALANMLKVDHDAEADEVNTKWKKIIAQSEEIVKCLTNLQKEYHSIM